jgi:hypothetical protein
VSVFYSTDLKRNNCTYDTKTLAENNGGKEYNFKNAKLNNIHSHRISVTENSAHILDKLATQP